MKHSRVFSFTFSIDSDDIHPFDALDRLKEIVAQWDDRDLRENIVLVEHTTEEE